DKQWSRGITSDKIDVPNIRTQPRTLIHQKGFEFLSIERTFENKVRKELQYQRSPLYCTTDTSQFKDSLRTIYNGKKKTPSLSDVRVVSIGFQDGGLKLVEYSISLTNVLQFH
ncbi:7201_t:CDS:1, partial [Acaulospora morrowiae]